MTVKEISDVLKVSPSAVCKHAKRLGLVVDNGVEANFNEEQVARISASFKDSVLPVNLGACAKVPVYRGSLPSTTLERLQIISDVYQELPTDKLMAASLSGLQLVLTRLTQENTQLKESLGVYNNFVTALRVDVLNRGQFDAKKGWRKVWKYCKEHNLEIKKIPDAHYGHINAYPLNAWYEVYPELDLPEEE